MQQIVLTAHGSLLLQELNLSACGVPRVTAQKLEVPQQTHNKMLYDFMYFLCLILPKTARPNSSSICNDSWGRVVYRIGGRAGEFCQSEFFHLRCLWCYDLHLAHFELVHLEARRLQLGQPTSRSPMKLKCCIWHPQFAKFGAQFDESSRA